MSKLGHGVGKGSGVCAASGNVISCHCWHITYLNIGACKVFGKGWSKGDHYNCSSSGLLESLKKEIEKTSSTLKSIVFNMT